MTPGPPARESRYVWRGVDAQGVPRRGALIALDAQQARAALKRDRIMVLELLERGAVRQRSVAAADITRFSRQLAGLLHAGLPLLAALELIAHNHARAHVAGVIGAVARNVLGGARLSAALARHPQSFDRVYCQMIMLGEASGTLAATLARLADERERSAAQRARLRAALSYPVGVLLLALAITAALLIWVVPTFAQIFDGVGATLPAPTRLVLALSAGVAHAALPVSLALAAAGLALQAGLRRSPALRLSVARAWLLPPVLGPLLRQLCVARWSRALSTLLAAGMPLADVFDTLSRITGNSVFDRATGQIGAALRRGERLAGAMRATGCFPSDVIPLIAVAEETGALEAMLADLATFTDKQVDERISALCGLLEPLVIVLLGAMVGGLVIAMYLPIIQLGNVV